MQPHLRLSTSNYRPCRSEIYSFNYVINPFPVFFLLFANSPQQTTYVIICSDWCVSDHNIQHWSINIWSKHYMNNMPLVEQALSLLRQGSMFIIHWFCFQNSTGADHACEMCVREVVLIYGTFEHCSVRTAMRKGSGHNCLGVLRCIFCEVLRCDILQQ